MDENRVRPAFSRTNKKSVPKGVININRKKPKIVKYNDSPTVFSYNFTSINEEQLEMPPMEE